MDFFHCNGCFAQPGQNINKSFFLADCGHSFCESCANTSESVCSVCRNKCKYLCLNSDVPDSVKSYFVDAVKELKKIIKVLLIQNKHCRIYMEEYAPTLEGKYVSAKVTIEKKTVEIESLKRTLQEKTTEIDTLQKLIKKMEIEMDGLKKRLTMSPKQNQMSPALLSPPSSYASSRSPQEFFTPKNTPSSGGQTQRSGGSCSRMSRDSFMSPSASSPSLFLEKKRPTAMELLFKNKDTPRRSSQSPMFYTPRSNQTFNMTINSSPESEDEKWGTANRRTSLTSRKSFF